MKPLRVAVVGAGRMGSNHLRIFAGLKGVELVAVVDPDTNRTADAASRYGCRVLPTVDDLIGLVDAVSIASPSVLHAEIGERLLSSGIHCLIEKPLAVTREECSRLISAADKAGVVLLVGHVERFNPAVRQLSAIIAEGHAVHAIDVHRMSYASSRITDVDVVADLMVHDLDIILSLTGYQPLADLAAHGVRTGGGRGEDYVTALLSFANGAVVSLTSSRITQNKVRKLAVTSDLGYITLDYIAQEILIHHQRSEATKTPQGSYVFDLQIEKVLVRTAEPLVQELQHFIDCIRLGTPPLVSGEQGLAALELVWAIQNKIKEAGGNDR